MCKILIFGGTTEGRQLAEFCEYNKIPAWVSVVSEYGKELLTESRTIKINAKAMDIQEMEQFFSAHEIGLVVDATHPYAFEVTENIRQACAHRKIRLIRCLRTIEAPETTDDSTNRICLVSDVHEAVNLLEHQPGRILLTTGSKELEAFSQMSGFKERGYVRVLPSLEAVQKCEELGIEKSHLICMQGPFSEEMNIALIHQVRADILITKETGAAGGFAEKLSAAKACGIITIVIKHRTESDGVTPETACKLIQEFSDSGVFLVGIGPGNLNQITEAAKTAICSSDVLFGAPRVLHAVKSLLRAEQRTIPRYLPVDVAAELEQEEKNGNQKIAILFSGDTGFYSGTKKMVQMLKEKGIPFSLFPGISSISYFAAKLGIPWEDAKLDTAHGRTFDPIEALHRGDKKMFLLLGGENGAGELCETLCANGYEAIQVSVGENLSYENERIITGTAKTLKKQVFNALSVALIQSYGREEEEHER
ncbi:MAG: precorrin-6A reductase [Clostridium sp.]